MKTWQLLAFVAALLMAGCSETPPVSKKTDWETKQLKGRVKQFKELQCTGYTMDGESVVLIPDSIRITQVARYNDIGKITEIEYYKRGELDRTQVSLYDDSGNRHEVRSLDPDGTLLEKSHYEFDAYGNIVKRTNFQNDGQISVRNYTLDENGNTTEIIDYDPDGNVNQRTMTPYDETGNRLEYKFETAEGFVQWMKYSYDEFGNMVENLTLDSLGNIINRIVNMFDEKGRAFETRVFNAKSGETLYLNTYNEKNELIERMNIPADGSPETRNTYKYNDKGERVELVEYGSDKSIIRVRKDEYEYDAEGNWIKHIVFVNDSVLLPVYLREIEYY